jgi:hypothetical protein
VFIVSCHCIVALFPWERVSLRCNLDSLVAAEKCLSGRCLARGGSHTRFMDYIIEEASKIELHYKNREDSFSLKRSWKHLIYCSKNVRSLICNIFPHQLIPFLGYNCSSSTATSYIYLPTYCIRSLLLFGSNLLVIVLL